MDLVHYDFLPVNQEVYWIRSSEEEPWLWTLFRGVVVRHFDIAKRYYYQCALQEVIASDEWIAKHVANKTFRFIDLESGNPTHHFVYIDDKEQQITAQTFWHDWKFYYAQKWLWDLTADIIWTSKQQALQGLAILYDKNCVRFDELRRLYETQIIELSKQSLTE